MLLAETSLRSSFAHSALAHLRVWSTTPGPFTETVLGNSIIGGVLGLVGALMWKSYATNSNKAIKDFYKNHHADDDK